MSLKVSQGTLVFCYLAFERRVTVQAKLKMSKVLGMAAGCTEEKPEQRGAQSQTAGGIPVQHFTECYRGQFLLSSVFLLMKQRTQYLLDIIVRRIKYEGVNEEHRHMPGTRGSVVAFPLAVSARKLLQ